MNVKDCSDLKLEIREIERNSARFKVIGFGTVRNLISKYRLQNIETLKVLKDKLYGIVAKDDKLIEIKEIK